MTREPFWMMPKWLAGALDDGRITPTAFLVLAYLGASGLEHYGVSTNQRELATKLDRAQKTIKRALEALRDEHRLIVFELKSGSPKNFRVTAGPALRSGVSALYFEPTSDTTSDIHPPPNVRGHLGHERNRERAQAQTQKATAPQLTSDTGELHEKETENNRTPLIHKERLVRRRVEGTHELTAGMSEFVERARLAAETHADLPRGHSWPTEHPGSEPDEDALVADAECLIDTGLAEWVEILSRPPLCGYAVHRDAGLDWANDGSRMICGICHPRGGGVVRPPALSFDSSTSSSSAARTREVAE